MLMILMKRKNLRIYNSRLSLLFVVLLSLVASPAVAEVSEKDILTLGKALSFVQNGPTGTVEIDIIYNEGNAKSLKEAREVEAILSSGVSSGKITLKGHKTERSTGARIAYITKGSEGKAQSLMNNGVITVSEGKECVLSHLCVLGVTTTPKIDFYVSSEATEKSGVLFKVAFQMMVTEY